MIEKFFDLGIYDQPAIGMVLIAVVEILVMMFGGVKRGSGGDFGNDLILVIT